MPSAEDRLRACGWTVGRDDGERITMTRPMVKGHHWTITLTAFLHEGRIVVQCIFGIIPQVPKGVILDAVLHTFVELIRSDPRYPADHEIVSTDGKPLV